MIHLLFLGPSWAKKHWVIKDIPHGPCVCFTRVELCIIIYIYMLKKSNLALPCVSYIKPQTPQQATPVDSTGTWDLFFRISRGFREGLNFPGFPAGGVLQQLLLGGAAPGRAAAGLPVRRQLCGGPARGWRPLAVEGVGT